MADGNVTITAKEKPPGYVFGRPAVYRAEFCDRIIELGKLGYSQAQMAADLGVSKQTITDWAKSHDDFSDALTLARTYSQSWWEMKAQTGLEDRNFNAAIWDKSVKSRFREDYTDRSINEIVGADGGAIQVNDQSIDARKVAFMLGRAIGRAESTPTIELDSIESR